MFINNDKIFLGLFKDDKKNGIGIFYWLDSKKMFIGFWKDGKKSGFGKIINNNKIKYGLWEDDDKHNYFKNEDEAMLYLDKNKMNNFKTIFTSSLDEIIKFIDFDKNILKKCEISNIFKENITN